jgi:DNA modification methylase
MPRRNAQRKRSQAASPVLQVVSVPIDQLVPDPANPRRIDDGQSESLTRSLREFGIVDPIIAREEDRRVIGGHQRLLAARRLGLTEVPVIFVDLSAEQADLLNLSLNKISGEWDEELLGQLLANLQLEPDLDVTLSGFAEGEVQQLLKRLETRTKQDRPETFDLEGALDQAGEKAPLVQPGDLWRLADHRLLCGDATQADDVARLMDGAQARMAVTDPPYNVKLGAHGGQRRGQRKRSLQNDDLSPEAWAAFCRGWIQSLAASVNGAIYCFMSTKEWPLVTRLFDEAGVHWSDTVIWMKDRFVLGRAPYQRQYEPLFFGWTEGAKPYWCGDRDQGDVWQVPRPAISDLHPTMKPLALVERAIANSSEPGDRVLDLFLGSGTTLIAAERTGRACVGMELDPHYCQIVINRWEAFTGETATRSAH